MKTLIVLCLFITLSLGLMSCGEDSKIPEVEIIDITKAYLNEDGYPVISFQITNPYKVPICLTETLLEEGSIHYFNFGLDIRTKYGRRLKEKIPGGYLAGGSKNKLLLAPRGQITNTLIIERSGENLKKLFRGRSDLTLRFSFFVSGCTSEEGPFSEPHFFAISDRVRMQ